MAGLTAATLLQDQGWKVTVIDKGRGVGGRMATRRLGDGGRADHGAQFFSTHSPEWQAWNAHWVQAGITRKWFDRREKPRYIVANGMSQLPKTMAQSLHVLTGVRIVRLEKTQGSYTVTSESGDTWTADRIVITFPAPQAWELLTTSGLGEAHQAVLKSISYAPCFTVMAVLDGVSDLPAPGGMMPDSPILGWVADNFQKGISPIPTLTLQTTPEFSRQHLEDPQEELKNQILASAAPWIGDRKILESSIHRWRYSLAETKYPATFFYDDSLPGVYLGGDGFGEGHVEAAFLSGYRIAHAMVGK